MNVEQMLAEITPNVRKAVMEAAEKEVGSALTYHLREEVQKEAAAYIQAEVLPEVRRQLAEKREEMVAGIVASVLVGVSAFGDKMQEKMIKNLGDSWRVDKLVKGILGEHNY